MRPLISLASMLSLTGLVSAAGIPNPAAEAVNQFGLDLHRRLSSGDPGQNMHSVETHHR